jgi:acetylornithine deacetylase/succinyl-diaminopimelate desuccinylase-like protein
VSSRRDVSLSWLEWLLPILLLATLPCLSAAQTLPPRAHRALARDILRELVEINTTRDSGATRAAAAVAGRLTAAGFPAGDVLLMGPKPHKQNLVVRLRGRGQGKPILFLAHLDVVEARREDWSLDPFRLTERDGYFYGRGTTDIKDEAADLVANLIRLKQEGYLPERDILVALTDDEEGGDDNGVEWLIEQRPDLLQVAYVINLDAGGGQMEKGRRRRNPVQTSEKLYATYRLEVTNPGGHSSLPRKDNAIYALAAALDRLSRYDFPVQLNETTRSFFLRLAEQDSAGLRDDLRRVAAARPDSVAVRRLSAFPMFNSTMRTTCVATMVQAGHAENALPQRATAAVQCRLLPDESPARVRQTLRRVIADSQIKIVLDGDPQPAPASPLSDEVMGAVERVTSAMWPGVIVLPVMDPWSSDGAALRRARLPVYGVSGVFYDIDDVRAHGQDERVSVGAFYEGVEFMYRLMKTLTEGTAPGPAPPASAAPSGPRDRSRGTP